MRRPKIGIALGSGGARGWCHIGAVKALLDDGIEPDVVAGCSMGAFVGAAYLTGGLDKLEAWAKDVTWIKLASLLDVSMTKGGLIDGARIPGILGSVNEGMTIQSLGKPFVAIATDLRSGREVWLQKGALRDAVRASISLPGILSPVKIDGNWLLDGGMTNPVPVSACRAMGAEVIVAVNPNGSQLRPVRPPKKTQRRRVRQSKLGSESLDRVLGQLPEGLRSGLGAIMPNLIGPTETTPSYFDVLATSISIMTDQIMRSRLAGEPPHVLVNPQLNDLSVLDFHRATEAIEEGRKAMQQQIPMLRDILG